MVSPLPGPDFAALVAQVSGAGSRVPWAVVEKPTRKSQPRPGPALPELSQVRATTSICHTVRGGPRGANGPTPRPAHSLGHSCRRVSCFLSRTPHSLRLFAESASVMASLPYFLPQPPAPKCQEEPSFCLELPLLCTWPHGDLEDGSRAGHCFPDHGCVSAVQPLRCCPPPAPRVGARAGHPWGRLVPRTPLLCGDLAWGRIMGASPPLSESYLEPRPSALRWCSPLGICPWPVFCWEKWKLLGKHQAPA